jgi:hypothetical protein
MIELRRMRIHPDAGASEPCKGRLGYCNATVQTERGLSRLDPRSFGSGREPTAEERADKRWPTACAACGRPFAAEDHWQLNEHRLFAGAPSGLLVTVAEAPPGAIWRALWNEDSDAFVGQDGRSYYVKLPDGTEWCPDAPAANSNRPWTRTGIAPELTCSPSIRTARYHGYLVGGHLDPCSDSET